MADTDRKARIVLSATDQTKAAFDKAKQNFAELRDQADKFSLVGGTIGLAIAEALTAVSLKGGIDTLDMLDDLSEKYGIAATDLSAYRYAAEIAGTSTEALADGLNKLSRNAAEAASGNKEIKAAFDAIGVSATDATGKLKNADTLILEIADKFSGYEDGAAKAALAQQLFGKTGAEMIPLLNRGKEGIAELRAEAEKLGAVYGNDLAKQAADFNDNLTKLKLAAEGAKIGIVNHLLPGLLDLTNTFIAARKEGSLLNALLVTIGRGIASTAGLDDLGAATAKAKAAGAEVERVTNIMVGLSNTLEREPGNAAARRRYDNLAATLRRLQADAQNATADLKSLANEAAPVTPPASGDPKPAKRQAPIVPNAAASAKKDSEAAAALSEYQALIDKIKARAAADREQLALGRQLTEAEKFQADIEAQLTGQKTKLTEAQKAGVRQAAEQVRGLDLQLEARARLRAAQDADAAAEQQALDALEQLGQARAGDVLLLRDQLATLGLSDRELEAHRVALMENALAVEQGALATAKATDAGAAEIAQRQENIRLLQQQIDVRKAVAAKIAKGEDDPAAGLERALKSIRADLAKSGDDVEKMVLDFRTGLSDGLTDALTGKGFDLKRLIDSMLAEVTRLQIVKPLLASIFGEGAGGGSLFATAFGYLTGIGGKADGGGVEAGMPHVVGERGRELFVPRVNGTIVPANVLRQAEAGGGDTITINPVYHIGQGVSRAEVVAAVQAGNNQLRADLLQSRRRGGRFE